MPLDSDEDKEVEALLGPSKEEKDDSSNSSKTYCYVIIAFLVLVAVVIAVFAALLVTKTISLSGDGASSDSSTAGSSTLTSSPTSSILSSTPVKTQANDATLQIKPTTTAGGSQTGTRQAQSSVVSPTATPTQTEGGSDPLVNYLSVPTVVPASATPIAIDFKDFKDGDNALILFLQTKDLQVRGDDVDSTPFSYTFGGKSEIVDDTIKLYAQPEAAQNCGSCGLLAAKIRHNAEAIKFAMVTTRCKISAVPGARQGIIFETAGSAKIELAFMTSYIETSDNGEVKPGMHLISTTSETSETVSAYDLDPTADFNDYTILWRETQVEVFLNKKQVGSVQKDILAESAMLSWYSFSNGDPLVSAGPPLEDAIFTIESITGWFVAGMSAADVQKAQDAVQTMMGG